MSHQKGESPLPLDDVIERNEHLYGLGDGLCGIALGSDEWEM